MTGDREGWCALGAGRSRLPASRATPPRKRDERLDGSVLTIRLHWQRGPVVSYQWSGSAQELGWSRNGPGGHSRNAREGRCRR